MCSLYESLSEIHSWLSMTFLQFCAANGSKVNSIKLPTASLQVRTNFKAAFLNEFRKDARGSLTAYVKAYEQLLKESDIIDFLERMDLCNHITLRTIFFMICHWCSLLFQSRVKYIHIYIYIIYMNCHCVYCAWAYKVPWPQQAKRRGWVKCSE